MVCILSFKDGLCFMSWRYVVYMIEIEKIEQKFENDSERKKVVEFLHKHLGKFGDPKDHIDMSIEYALSTDAGRGGFVLVGRDESGIVGSVVMNKTGMSGYIPQYLLVYIAVHGDRRGKGIGGKLMNEALDACKGDVALHVEYENPAKRLYERLGFSSKYAEMRWYRTEQ